MLCNEGKLSNYKKEFCKFYIGRTHILNGVLIEEHYCNNEFMIGVAETFENYGLVDLSDKLIKTCNLYIPYKLRKYRKRKKHEKHSTVKK